LEGIFEDEIAPEENPGAEAEHGRREPQIFVHLKRSKADIHTVDEDHEIQQHDERDDTQGQFA
jgi:hypothetical protein